MSNEQKNKVENEVEYGYIIFAYSKDDVKCTDFFSFNWPIGDISGAEANAKKRAKNKWSESDGYYGHDATQQDYTVFDILKKSAAENNKKPLV